MKYALLVSSLLFALSAEGQPSFLTVGELPGGFAVSNAGGVSGNGTVVTGNSFTNTGTTGFVWRPRTGIEQLPPILNSGSYTGARVSPSGNIIIGRDGGLGAVWSDQYGNHSIGDVPGGAARSFLYDVNDVGLAVGQASHAFNTFNAPLYRAVRWTPSGGLETLPLPGGESDLQSNSTAWSVLDDGRIFGVSAAGAWLYSESTGFEMLEDAESMLRSNSEGTFLTGQVPNLATQADVPAFWTPDGGLQQLPRLRNGDAGPVFGMSNDGSVIVGKSGPDNVVWIDQGQPMRIVDFAASLGLDMNGWVVTNVINVSLDGTTIVGSARHQSWEAGRIEGFVLTIPAPAGAGVIAALGLHAIRRRRR